MPDQQQTSGQIRILAAALSGYLAGKGVFFDEATWNVILFSVFTAGMAAWSGIALSRKNQKISVAAIPNTFVAEKTDDASGVRIASAIAEIPGVRQITATSEIATNTPSTKVVATPTAPTV